MIIVEGCDGAGKTSLIRDILNYFPNLMLGPRASDSIGGVSHHTKPEGLSRWVDAEMAKWIEPGYGPRIYDRHPLISEPIYGSIVRQQLSPQFTAPWFRTRLNTLRKSCLVIFVDPGWDTVASRLSREQDDQMPGVKENAKALWLAYRTLGLSWQGHAATHISGDPRSILTTVSMVDHHIKNWKF